MINVSGNYGHLGLITFGVSISALDDSIWPESIKNYFDMNDLEAGYFDLVILCFSSIMLGLYILITLIPLMDVGKVRVPNYSKIFRKIYSKLYLIYETIIPFRIINRYGMFGTLHNFRWELTIEGSHDMKEWKQYMFRYKVNDDHRPKFIPLYWPRIDWHLWFIPLRLKESEYINQKKNRKRTSILVYEPFKKFKRRKYNDHQYVRNKSF